MENLTEILEGPDLHQWVDQQQQAYNLGNLSKDEMEEVERLPEWFWNHFGAKWISLVERLKKVMQEKNNTMPSASKQAGAT